MAADEPTYIHTEHVHEIEHPLVVIAMRLSSLVALIRAQRYAKRSRGLLIADPEQFAAALESFSVAAMKLCAFYRLARRR